MKEHPSYRFVHHVTLQIIWSHSKQYCNSLTKLSSKQRLMSMHVTVIVNMKLLIRLRMKLFSVFMITERMSGL